MKRLADDNEGHARITTATYEVVAADFDHIDSAGGEQNDSTQEFLSDSYSDWDDGLDPPDGAYLLVQPTYVESFLATLNYRDALQGVGLWKRVGNLRDRF